MPQNGVRPLGGAPTIQTKPKPGQEMMAGAERVRVIQPGMKYAVCVNAATGLNRRMIKYGDLSAAPAQQEPVAPKPAAAAQARPSQDELDKEFLGDANAD